MNVRLGLAVLVSVIVRCGSGSLLRWFNISYRFYISSGELPVSPVQKQRRWARISLQYMAEYRCRGSQACGESAGVCQLPPFAAEEAWWFARSALQEQFELTLLFHNRIGLADPCFFRFDEAQV